MIRNKIRAATYIGTKGRDLRVLFTRLDKDHSGKLSKEEFAHGLKKIVSLSDQEQELLWKRVDVDGSGEIEIEEFSAFVLNNKNVKVADTYHHYDGHDPFDRRQTYRNKGMSPDARTKAAVRKLKLRLRNESKVNVESMCKAFLKADTQSIGKLTYSRFKEYLSEQCPELTEREINVFIKQVDPSGMGTISCESMTPFLISINEDESLSSTERIRRRRSPHPSSSSSSSSR